MQTRVPKFKRRWIWFGDLISDEGFSLRYGNRSITYTDRRGSFEFGLEDGLLFPNAKQIAGSPVVLDKTQLHAIIERVVRGVRSEGHDIEIFSK